jgi:hypothetical protein
MISDPPTRATYFSTLVVLAIFLIDQIKKLPTSSATQPVTPSPQSELTKKEPLSSTASLDDVTKAIALSHDRAKLLVEQWVLSNRSAAHDFRFSSILDSLQGGEDYSTLEGSFILENKKCGFMVRVMKRGAIDEDNSFLFI